MIDISLLIAKAPAAFAAAAKVIASASAVAALTPTPKDDTFVANVHRFFFKVVNFLALNVMNAKVEAPKNDDFNR